MYSPKCPVMYLYYFDTQVCPTRPFTIDCLWPVVFMDLYRNQGQVRHCMDIFQASLVQTFSPMPLPNAATHYCKVRQRRMLIGIPKVFMAAVYLISCWIKVSESHRAGEENRQAIRYRWLQTFRKWSLAVREAWATLFIVTTIISSEHSRGTYTELR